MSEKSIIVIGGGPGGYVAAIRSSQLGAKVTLIEKDKIGGTCLNIGCIPTKSILHSAEIYSTLNEASLYGINVKDISIDFQKVQNKKEEIVNQLVNGVSGLMKVNNIKVINAKAEFISKEKIKLTYKDGKTENVWADKIIIASGSIPAIPPIEGINNNPHCIDSTGILSLNKIPKSLIVIGGGVIGIEFACAFNRFGTKVTVIEALPKILPLMDGELSEQLKIYLEYSGIKILTDTKVKKINGEKVEVESKGKIDIFDAENILVAVGRIANTKDLNLNAAGIKNDRGKIKVNEKMETNLKNVYAIGDCLGQIMLAHIASKQGEVAAENSMGHHTSYNQKTAPSCVYTDLEFSSVGLTEEECKAKKIEYYVGKFPLMANGKSLIMNGGKGIVKFLVGKEYKDILGVHILGPRATDLIGECALALGMEATIEDIISTIHAHPTISEAIFEAALSSDKIAIHIPNKK
ncbi:dihydrolipoyl dehydrogenase [Brachyspira aalborgi]|uniref:Dihydrolipoyl dehydrogenase n=1 Tax=Brachyspira aalborgi TaxID=29522 RepID=A0A5C8DAW4_9SPIR|nr:dihydrolipoyl dehydrogenase [Brachyspira aalborgi]TXJ21561.1 dihydrolipoyl dehydrogenase [Brachyspira aalborgi]